MIKFPENDVYFSSLKNPEEWGAKDFNTVKKYIKNFRTAIDVGAHVGLTTLRYSKFFDYVYAFEPLHSQLLKQNTKKCANVYIYNFALSDQTGKLKIYRNVWNSGGGIIPTEHNKEIIKQRYQQKIHPRVGVKENDLTEIKCMELDNLNLKNVDFIKIDVERYNYWVLKGSVNTLKNNKPVIQVEKSKDKLDNMVIDFLLNLDYKIITQTNTEFFFN